MISSSDIDGAVAFLSVDVSVLALLLVLALVIAAAAVAGDGDARMVGDVGEEMGDIGGVEDILCR